jgi:ATP-dependent helicase/nuclease subunit B
VADRDESIRDAVREGRVLTDGVSRVVVLLADPEPVQRELLERLAARGVRVEVCVHRDDGVDDAGFPIAARWEAHPFPTSEIASEAIRVGGRPNESAEVAVEAIRALSAGRAPLSSDELLVMAPDDETSRALERALALAGAPAATVEARSFGATRLGTLLERLADLIGEGSAESLAAFVRHDDVARWLSTVEGMAEVGDAGGCVADYRSETLVGAWREAPITVDADTVWHRRRLVAEYALLQGAVLRAVAPLEGRKRAADWAQPLRGVLAELSGAAAEQRAASEAERAGDAEERGRFSEELAASIRLLDRELKQLHDLPAAFASPVGCSEAIALVLSALSSEEIRGPRRADGVTVAGWLDAGMADEPHIVLTGFAEGQMPEGTVTDPLVPDGIRAALGMMSGVRRAARDAWILDGILLRARARATQPGGASVSFVVPRQTEAGDPLKPSRFLLRVEDEALPERVTQLFPTDQDSKRSRFEAAGDAGPAARFESTPPIKPATDESMRITSISVTAFKTFLECPYLFQLRYDPRLKLGDLDERAMELDARGFGNLVHAALERWGREEIAEGGSTEDPSKIERSASAHLDAIVGELYPKSCAAAVRVQVELARRRIRRFAQLQAEQARLGWKVHHVELSFQRQPKLGAGQAPWIPDENGLSLTGRIDRVDRHDIEGRYRALDYKTGAKAESPTATHVKKSRSDAGNPGGSRWVDLQLPLYRVLLRSMSPSIEVGAEGLGYVNLAPTAEKSGFVMLDPTKVNDAMLDEAEALAGEIVAKIKAGSFIPEKRVPVGADDALAPIWGVGQRGLVAGRAGEGAYE